MYDEPPENYTPTDREDWERAMYHSGTPVLEFHQAFDHPVAYAPTVPSIEQRMLRVKLLAEELCELATASGVWVSIYGNVEVKVAPASDPVDLVEAADALADIRYLVDGGNLIFGFPGEQVLHAVHKSNMSKLGADGKPLRREDGKTLKGPNYKPPTDDIRALLGAPSP
jgi:predicted HAD superfamily Cof-like phosphohydrolase